MTQLASRRDRLRAATTQEIKATARRILVTEGSEAVSLRAIARQIGMTAPALYRYFDSHEELLRHVVADMYTELATELEQGIESAPSGDLPAKFTAAARGFRQWSLAHKAEFSLLFGTPISGRGSESIDIADECGQRFGRLFLGLFADLWRKHPFPIPSEDDIAPPLRNQLEKYQASVREQIPETPMPLGALLAFITCWSRLYGMVCLEVFGHLTFALDNPEPMFDLMLADLARLLGLAPPPSAT